MNTWLPFASLGQSVSALRRQELGRQRVDIVQALYALLRPEHESKWRFHPVVRMWRGYDALLFQMYELTVKEWCARGYQHNMTFNAVAFARLSQRVVLPWWFNNVWFHEAQQAVLYSKDPEHYKAMQNPWVFVDEQTQPKALWPVLRNGKNNRALFYG